MKRLGGWRPGGLIHIEGLTQGCRKSPPHVQREGVPFHHQCHNCTSLTMLSVIPRHPPETAIRKPQRKRVYYLKRVQDIQHMPGANREVMGGESLSRPWGYAFTGIEGGGA